MTKYLTLLMTCTLLACSPGEKELDPSEHLILKTYQVPDGMQEKVRLILNQNFQVLPDNRLIARVEVLPDGQLALVGPENIHRGMSDLIKNLNSAKVEPAENSNLEVWMILANNEKEKAHADAQLANIQSLLNEVAVGQNSFYLYEKFKVTAKVGKKSFVSGETFRMEYALYKSMDQTIADLELMGLYGSKPRLNTQIYLEPGKTTVLAEAHHRIKGNNPSGVPEGNYTLYYVLRAGN